MDGRLTHRDVLLRRVTCSDLIASRNASQRRSVPNSVSSASGSTSHSLATSCVPSIPEGLDNDDEDGKLNESPLTSKTCESTPAIRKDTPADRRSGKERMRSLVKMTSAVSLFRKVTATVQKHAVQLSYDYAPPPSVLYGEAYRTCTYLQRPADAAGTDVSMNSFSTQKTSMSTCELSMPQTNCNYPKPMPMDSARTVSNRFKSLAESGLKTAGTHASVGNSIAAISGIDMECAADSVKHARFVRPLDLELGHRRSEPRLFANSYRQSVSNEILNSVARPVKTERSEMTPNGNDRDVDTQPIVASVTHSEIEHVMPKRKTSSCTSESQHPIMNDNVFVANNTKERKRETREDSGTDEEIDVAELGDALQSHLKALMMRKRLSAGSVDFVPSATGAETDKHDGGSRDSVEIYTESDALQQLNSIVGEATTKTPLTANKKQQIEAQSPDASTSCSWSMFRIHKRKSSAAV